MLSVVNASGIMTFPSAHAAVALLRAWAMWDVKPMRYPFAGWNALMASSAVSHANHDLVDVIAGLGMAALSIATVTFCPHKLSSKSWRLSWPLIFIGHAMATDQKPMNLSS